MYLLSLVICVLLEDNSCEGSGISHWQACGINHVLNMLVYWQWTNRVDMVASRQAVLWLLRKGMLNMQSYDIRIQDASHAIKSFRIGVIRQVGKYA